MGPGGWLAHVADRLLDRGSGGRIRFHVLRFYLQPLPAIPALSERPGDAIKVGPIDPTAFDAAAFGRPAEAIAERTRSGAMCIGAVKDDALLGFIWAQKGTLQERIVRCRMSVTPSSNVAWDFDVFVQPRFRLGRVFGRLWNAMARALREDGFSATISWIRLGNRASESAHEKLGAFRIAWAAFLTVFDHQLMLSSERPRIAYAPPGKSTHLTIDVAESLER